MKRILRLGLPQTTLWSFTSYELLKGRDFAHFLCILRIKHGTWNILGAENFLLNEYMTLRQNDVNNLKLNYS